MLFNRKYLLLFILLFFVEVYIALYVHDDIIRPYGGDTLVVILIYFFIRTFFQLPVIKTAVAIFLFACCIEVAQYLNIVDLLHLQNNKIASVVIGTSFAWLDILAYFIGTLAIIFVKQLTEKSFITSSN